MTDPHSHRRGGALYFTFLLNVLLTSAIQRIIMNALQLKVSTAARAPGVLWSASSVCLRFLDPFVSSLPGDKYELRAPSMEEWSALL